MTSSRVGEAEALLPHVKFPLLLFHDPDDSIVSFHNSEWIMDVVPETVFMRAANRVGADWSFLGSGSFLDVQRGALSAVWAPILRIPVRKCLKAGFSSQRSMIEPQVASVDKTLLRVPGGLHAPHFNGLEQVLPHFRDFLHQKVKCIGNNQTHKG